jgi:hypothetical protein
MGNGVDGMNGQNAVKRVILVNKQGDDCVMHHLHYFVVIIVEGMLLISDVLFKKLNKKKIKSLKIF